MASYKTHFVYVPITPNNETPNIINTTHLENAEAFSYRERTWLDWLRIFGNFLLALLLPLSYMFSFRHSSTRISQQTIMYLPKKIMLETQTGRGRKFNEPIIIPNYHIKLEENLRGKMPGDALEKLELIEESFMITAIKNKVIVLDGVYVVHNENDENLVLNGLTSTLEKPLRFFHSETDAKNYAALLNKQAEANSFITPLPAKNIYKPNFSTINIVKLLFIFVNFLFSENKSRVMALSNNTNEPRSNNFSSAWNFLTIMMVFVKKCPQVNITKQQNTDITAINGDKSKSPASQTTNHSEIPESHTTNCQSLPESQNAYNNMQIR